MILYCFLWHCLFRFLPWGCWYVQIWALLTWSECWVSDTQVNVKVWGPLVLTKFQASNSRFDYKVNLAPFRQLKEFQFLVYIFAFPLFLKVRYIFNRYDQTCLASWRVAYFRDQCSSDESLTTHAVCGHALYWHMVMRILNLIHRLCSQGATLLHFPLHTSYIQNTLPSVCCA